MCVYEHAALPLDHELRNQAIADVKHVSNENQLVPCVVVDCLALGSGGCLPESFALFEQDCRVRACRSPHPLPAPSPAAPNVR